MSTGRLSKITYYIHIKVDGDTGYWIYGGEIPAASPVSACELWLGDFRERMMGNGVERHMWTIGLSLKPLQSKHPLEYFIPGKSDLTYIYVGW